MLGGLHLCVPIRAKQLGLGEDGFGLSGYRQFMAEGIFFLCSNCHREIESWSDGNPYYIDALGEKVYAYHPSQDLERCIGNDDPHLCLNCGAKFMVDSNDPRTDCPECHAAEISSTFSLEGKRCPYCKRGSFARDSARQAIS